MNTLWDIITVKQLGMQQRDLSISNGIKDNFHTLPNKPSTASWV